MSFIDTVKTHGSTVLFLKDGKYVSNESNPLQKSLQNQTINQRIYITEKDENGSAISQLFDELNPESLWKIYENKNKSKLEEEIEKKVNEILKSVLKTQETKLSSILNLDTDYVNTVKMAIFEICPKLIERNSDEIENIINNDEINERSEFIDYLETKINIKKHDDTNINQNIDNKLKEIDLSDLTLKKPIEFSDYFKNKILNILNHFNAKGILIHSQDFFYLHDQITFYNSISIVIDKEKYQPINFVNTLEISAIDQIFTEYTTILSNYLAEKKVYNSIKNSIKDKDNISISNSERKLKILSEVFNKKKFEFEDFGFKLIPENKEVVIYLKVPKYALKDHIGEITSEDYGYRNIWKGYYLFPETKIATKIYKYGTNLSCGKPYLMEFSYSPFISEGCGENKTLCMGTYDVIYFSKISFPNAIVKYLNDAKKILTKGYTYKAKPHKLLTSSVFDSLKVQKKDIERMNIPITNE